jgi:CSLREA domain-containing protein/uncharacterized repeat protein (TIGR01451 family)
MTLFPGAPVSLAATTIVVTTTDDELNGDGDCSLREAIQAANANGGVDQCPAGSGTDTVVVPAGTYTLSIPGTNENANATGDLDITSPLMLSGAGAATTVIDGADLDRVIETDFWAVTIDGLTIRNGTALNGGGVYDGSTQTLTISNSVVTANHSTGDGGGIFSTDSGSLALTRTVVSANTATHGAGIDVDFGSMSIHESTLNSNVATGIGGGLYVEGLGSATVTSSTITANQASDGAGVNNGAGGGSITLTNTTVSANVASFQGGGIFTSPGGSASTTLNHATFSGNGAASGGDAIYINSGAVSMTGSILANSTTGSDCAGSAIGSVSSGGHNLIETNGCTITGDATGNLLGLDPNLGALADNGGPTLTHALLAGSPAIDAAGASGPATDQRGVPRPQGLAFDIGAFEVPSGPQTLTVTTTDDELNSDGDCSLREATHAANTNAVVDACGTGFAADTVIVPAGTYSMNFGDSLKLLESVNLVGAGAGSTTITQLASNQRVLSILPGVTADVGGFTLSGGHDSSGGSAHNQGTFTLHDSVVTGAIANLQGGAIFNAAGGSLTLLRATLTGNSAVDGGGINHRGVSTQIVDSTIAGNSAIAAGGGLVVFAPGTVTMTNSTISGNSAQGGGGIFVDDGGSVTVAHSTIAGNINTTPLGGGIYNDNGAFTLTGTIVANSAGGDCAANGASTITSGGHNLIETPGACAFTGDTATNVTGADPMLGPLADNGGPTKTHALLTGSPAIDAAGSTGPATDQRGVLRPQGSFFDIGAYEKVTGDQTISVDTTEDELNSDGDCSLREAIRATNINGPVSGCPAGDDGMDTIVVPAGLYELVIAGTGEDAALTGDLDITGDLTITGAGADSTIVDANDLDRVFHVISAETTLEDLTVRDGTTGTFGGGGIRNDGTGLTLRRTVVTMNAVTSGGNRGGGILNDGDTMILIDATVSGNTAIDGGAGIQNYNGSLSLTDSTVSGNTEVLSSISTEEGGAGISSSGGTLTLLRSSITGNSGALHGGGIRLWCMSSVTITESTISGNQANSPNGLGGGVDVPCGGGLTTITNSTISGNTAAAAGGGYRNPGSGVVTITNSTIAGNGAPLGGGLSGTFTLNQSLVADSTAGGDCAGTITSGTGFNLIEDVTGCTLSGTTTGNVTGVDPMLGPLADNGGPTLTHALLVGSPAIDAAGSTGPATDQRGVLRPQGSFFDIGAYELTTGPVSIDVTTTDDELNGDEDCSLREAIRAANINGPVSGCPAGDGDDTIVVPAGTYDLDLAGAGENAALTGDLDITESLTISGAGAATTIVDGDDLDRVFEIRAGSNELTGLTIRDGFATGSTINDGCCGGGILVMAGSLDVTAALITLNSATIAAGIGNFGGVLTVTDSTIDANVASGDGGGVYTWAQTSLVRTTVSGNQGGFSAGVGNDGTTTITNSTISGNTGASQGGGVHNTGTMTILDSTLASNGASTGGGVFAHAVGTMTLDRTIVADSVSGGDCSGSVGSAGGHNLIESTSGCTLTGTTTGNVTGVDPMLGPLQDNLGPTFTHALLDGSPAIDAAGATCSATDQRGVLRPQGPFCDIGAFEAPPTGGGTADLSIVKSDTADPVTVGDTFTYGIQVTNAGPENATGVTLVDALPPEVSFSSYTSSRWSCVHDEGVVTCDLGMLGVDGTAARARVLINVTAVSEGTATNTASVTSNEDDPTTPNEATTTTTINDVPGETPPTLTVQRMGSGRGSVTSQPAGISCGRDCTEVYAEGATVVLRARPRSGTTFIGWGGGCASAGANLTCTLVMDGDKTVTATFTLT